MVRAIVYDMDGMVLTGARFSDAYSKEFDIPLDDMTPFFAGPFQKCILGQADLKEELAQGNWLEKWRWQGSVEELLKYWFRSGGHIDERMLENITSLRAQGILCVLTTNQEKYRAAFIRDELGLGERFDSIIVSSEIGCKKPHTEFFEKVTAYLNERDASIRPSEVLFWDDRPENCSAAKDFGFDARSYETFDGYESVVSTI